MQTIAREMAREETGRAGPSSPAKREDSRREGSGREKSRRREDSRREDPVQEVEEKLDAWCQAKVSRKFIAEGLMKDLLRMGFAREKLEAWAEAKRRGDDATADKLRRGLWPNKLRRELSRRAPQPTPFQY